MTTRPRTEPFSIRRVHTCGGGLPVDRWEQVVRVLDRGRLMKHFGVLTKRRNPTNGGRSAQTEPRDSRNERSLSHSRTARRSLSTTHAHATSCSRYTSRPEGE